MTDQVALVFTRVENDEIEVRENDTKFIPDKCHNKRDDMIVQI